MLHFDAGAADGADGYDNLLVALVGFGFGFIFILRVSDSSADSASTGATMFCATYRAIASAAARAGPTSAATADAPRVLHVPKHMRHVRQAPAAPAYEVVARCGRAAADCNSSCAFFAIFLGALHVFGAVVLSFGCGQAAAYF